MDIKLDQYQQKFVDALVKGYNAKSNAVYGAGKTTMSLVAASMNPNKKFLLILYNTRLKIDTQARIKELGLKNITAMSIHSCATKYYKLCHNDFLLQEILDDDLKTFIFANFDVIIFDEVQDFNKRYIKFAKKIVNELCAKNVQIGIIGDEKQLLYEYNLANTKYLKYPEKYFATEFKFIDCPLKISYRLTTENAQFINKCVLDEDRIETPLGKHGPKPIYYKMKSGFDLKPICKIIIDLLKSYKYDDINIIAFSIKSALGPARKLENMLVNNKIPCYVPIGDDAVLDVDLMANKVSFMTMHQSKGTENKVVLILGFDESLSEFYKQDTTSCSNALAVALSRAKERLIMCVGGEQLKFLKLDEQLVDIIGGGLKINRFLKFQKSEIFKDNKNLRFLENKIIGISSMTNHKVLDTLLEALKIIKYEVIQKPIKVHDVELKIKFKDSYEEVSELYGVCIPAIYEFTEFKSCSMNNLISESKKDLFKVKNMMMHTLDYITERDGFKFKKAQIKDFDWIDKDAIKSALDTIKCYLPQDQLEFETLFTKSIEFGGKHVDFVGRSDIVDIKDLVIWELKCTKELKKEHILQLAGYLAISGYKMGNLLNAFTGEIIQVFRPKDPEKFLSLFI